MIKLLTLPAILLSAAICLNNGGIQTVKANNRYAPVDSGINYTETIEPVVNPERGFYKAFSHKFASNSERAAFDVDTLRNYLIDYGLLHFRFGLESFSANAGGRDMPLTEAMLTSLAATLQNLRVAGGTAIIRFSYNLFGVQDDNGYINAEPSLELIETHVGQIGGVIKDYADVIAGVETGMLGPWGEQHSTILGNSSESNADTFFRLVEAWLKAAPTGRAVSVRRPLYFIYWANIRYGLELNTDNIGEYIPDADSDARRVGVFNDGYLGSSSDLGTFTNRKSETAFLNNQATYTLYGGEVVADDETGTIGSYNNIDFISVEGFITHTSYLHYDWNYERVIKQWQNSMYTGDDEIYKNKASQFEYVANRLGYRLVMRKSELSVEGSKLQLSIDVENVGFGNVVNEKVVSVIVSDGKNEFTATTSIDIRKLLSGTTRNISLTLRLPSSLNPGECSAYLKISDRNEIKETTDRSIYFSNADERVIVRSLGANYVGGFTADGGDGENLAVLYESFTDIDEAVQQPNSVSFIFKNGSDKNVYLFAQNGFELEIIGDDGYFDYYDFGGWTDGSAVYAVGAKIIVEADIVFTPVLAAKKFTVTFNAAGGSVVSGSLVQNIERGGSAVPPVLEREGYVLLGFNIDYSDVQSDMIVTARWGTATASDEGCNSSIWACVPSLSAVLIILAAFKIVLLNKKRG